MRYQTPKNYMQYIGFCMMNKMWLDSEIKEMKSVSSDKMPFSALAFNRKWIDENTHSKTRICVKFVVESAFFSIYKYK